MAKKATQSPKRTVSCIHCSRPIQVSVKTMSIFCPHCNKRVVCEDYTIRSYHAVRSVSTCGNIIVERKGHVVAPIRAESLIVRGLVRGSVVARNVVQIESTGTIQGNVEAPNLIVRDGGKLIGQCKITRNGRSTEPKRADKADKKEPSSSPPPTRRSAAATPRSPSRRQSTRVRT